MGRSSRAVALLLVVLGACCANAYPTIWTAMTAKKDCTAVPQASYGPHGAPVQDAKTLLTVKRNGGAVVKVCPGVVHEIKAVFPEQRQYILTTTQGGFSGTTTECPNRSISQVAKPEMAADLAVPCDATGAVTLKLLSVGAHAKDRTYQAISVTMPVKELEHCPASPCNSKAAQGALRPEAGEAAPGAAMEQPAAGPVDTNTVTLDPSLLQNGNIGVGELLARLGVTEQQLKSLQGGGDKAAAPLPGATAAPEAPKGPFNPIEGLKHLFGQGQGQQQGQHKDGGVNPIKFLQTIAALMPKEGGGAAAEGGEGNQAMNALKMVQNLAALVAPKGEEGAKEGAASSGAPILNLLQTVGAAINGGGSGASAQKDGLPILNILQTLGSAVAKGGEGGGAAPMLDVVRSLGALMPSEGGAAGSGPNMHNLMSFVNAVGKALPAGAGSVGVGAADAAGAKDIPGAAIAVLKSMGPLLPKEAAGGVAAAPNWPAMLQFMKASGNLLSLLRPPTAHAEEAN